MHMENVPIPTASYVQVDKDVLLDASALNRGDGGKIVVWADDATEFYGTAVSRGGNNSGNGGVVEISGGRRVVANGHVDVSAKAGRDGHYLIDPAGLLITSKMSDFVSAFDENSMAFVDYLSYGGSVYVLSTRLISSSDYRVDPDGTRAYKASIIVTKVDNGQIVAQSEVAQKYVGHIDGQGWPSVVRGSIGTSNGSIKVFFSEKSLGSNYSQAGYVYTLDAGTLAMNVVSTLFSGNNWGWFPYFDNNGDLWHFSFAGYSQLKNTNYQYGIQPEGAVINWQNRKLVAVGDAGDLTQEIPLGVWSTTLLRKVIVRFGWFKGSELDENVISLIQQHGNDTVSQLLVAVGGGLFVNSPDDPVWKGLYVDGTATSVQKKANELQSVYDKYKTASADTIYNGLKSGEIKKDDYVWTALVIANSGAISEVLTRLDADRTALVIANSDASAAALVRNLIQQHGNDTVSQLLVAVGGGLFVNSPDDPVWKGLYVDGTATSVQKKANELQSVYDKYKTASADTIYNGLKSGEIKKDDYVWTALVIANSGAISEVLTRLDTESVLPPGNTDLPKEDDQPASVLLPGKTDPHKEKEPSVQIHVDYVANFVTNGNTIMQGANDSLSLVPYVKSAAEVFFVRNAIKDVIEIAKGSKDLDPFLQSLEYLETINPKLHGEVLTSLADDNPYQALRDVLSKSPPELAGKVKTVLEGMSQLGTVLDGLSVVTDFAELAAKVDGGVATTEDLYKFASNTVATGVTTAAGTTLATGAAAGLVGGLIYSSIPIGKLIAEIKEGESFSDSQQRYIVLMNSIDEDIGAFERRQVYKFSEGKPIDVTESADSEKRFIDGKIEVLNHIVEDLNSLGNAFAAGYAFEGETRSKIIKAANDMRSELTIRSLKIKDVVQAQVQLGAKIHEKKKFLDTTRALKEKFQMIPD